MRNLLNFILRYGTWFVFAFYVLLSLVLLFSGRSYNQSIWFTSANALTGGIYRASNGVSGYFNLRSINKELQESNAQLENEVLNLRMQLADYESILTDLNDSVGTTKRFDYILATVINNDVRHPRNYFTINRGEKDGVKAGLGVVDQNGIVGIVNVVGENTSRVISLLNSTQRYSVKLKDSPFVGSLVWKGNDPKIAYVEEIPRHASFAVGDTVVTSGYSTTFPANLPVGVVMARVKAPDDNFYILKIRLTSSFNTLSTVRVIKDFYKEELDSLKNYDIKVEE